MRVEWPWCEDDAEERSDPTIRVPLSTIACKLLRRLSQTSIDPGILLLGALLLVGVVASELEARFRIPSLLLFLGLGMLGADEG